MRLDKWLKVSRIIKRRTVANEACDNARVNVNGRPVKASYDVKVGDVLFAAAKVGRFLGHDSEQALHGTCEKFITRFRRVEEQAEGKPLTEYPLSELEQMWQKAKEKEHSV